MTGRFGHNAHSVEVHSIVEAALAKVNEVGGCDRHSVRHQFRLECASSGHKSSGDRTRRCGGAEHPARGWRAMDVPADGTNAPTGARERGHRLNHEQPVAASPCLPASSGALSLTGYNTTTALLSAAVLRALWYSVHSLECCRSQQFRTA